MFRPDPTKDKCFLSNEVCERTDCVYYERMTPYGRSKYGNCALRVANEGPHTLGELARITGLSKERIRQIEARALRHLAYNALKINPKLREVIEAGLGPVLKWPPNPSRINVNRPVDSVSVFGDFLLKFVRDSHRSLATEKIRCYLTQKVVPRFVCAFCTQPCSLRGDAVGMFLIPPDELVERLRDAVTRGVELNTRPALVRDRALLYLQSHPNASVKELASAIKCSTVYARKCIKLFKRGQL